MKKFTKLFLMIVMMMSPLAFYGQDNAKFNDYVYVNGDLGLGLLGGDNSSLKAGLNGHLGIGYQFDNILGIKANLGFGGLNGGYEDVTLDKSNYFEANVNLTVNFTDIILGYNPDRKFNAVPHIGIGQAHYKVRLTDENGNVVKEYGYSKRDGRKVVATVPMGIELNYAINPSLKVYLDYTANHADSDLLDGVARGENNDWYTTVNLGASYKLGSEFNIFKRDGMYCNYWYLMADGGASMIFGDNKYDFADVKGNMNFGIGYNFHNFYRIYAKLGYGMYTGEYKNLFTLDYSDYYEANINIGADLVGFIFGYDEARRYGVYAHIGIGQMQYRARATYANGHKAYVGYHFDAANNQKGNGIADRKVALTVPMGLELNYIVNERVDMYADVTTNFADSDVLDAFASGNAKDWHSTVNVGLRYKFNRYCYNPNEVEAEEKDCCITPEDVKKAVEEALKEHAANQPKEVETKTEVVEKRTTYHTNHANIVFPVNESEKLKSQTNIDALNRASQEVQDGFQVEEIIVEGYSSPEGGDDINDRLAEERAQAAANLVQEELNTHLDASQVKIHSNGADWEGLYNAILGSDLNNKNQIVDELKAASDKEQTLRKLMGQYPQIESLLPQLRRANVTITTVKE